MPAYSEFLVHTPNHETDRPFLTAPGLPIGLDNLTFKEHQLPNLVDVRTLADDAMPKFDKEGFQYIKHKSTAADALANNDDQQAYWAEVTALTKDFLGAETVFPYMLKKRGPDQSPPSYKAHCDLPEYSAWPNNLSRILTKEECELVLSGKYRCRIVNVWRPLVNHAEDYPLAVMDIRSFNPKDVTWVEAVSCATPVAEVKEFPTTGTRTMVDYIHYNPDNRWYWMSNQTPDEPLIFTQWDSHPPDGEDQFNRTAHAAFRNSDAREGCPLRQSVESRMVVLEPAPYQRTKPLPGTESRPGPWETDTRNVLWAPYLTIDNSSLFNKPSKPGGRPDMNMSRPLEINVGMQKRVNVRA